MKQRKVDNNPPPPDTVYGIWEPNHKMWLFFDNPEDCLTNDDNLHEKAWAYKITPIPIEITKEIIIKVNRRLILKREYVSPKR